MLKELMSSFTFPLAVRQARWHCTIQEASRVVAICLSRYVHLSEMSGAKSGFVQRLEALETQALLAQINSKLQNHVWLGIEQIHCT